MSREFISFRIGKESFAVEAVRVREVLKSKPITEVPGMPAYLPGVINLRGNVISVIDPGAVLGVQHLQDASYQTWFIIAEVRVEKEPLQVGMLVDTVEDVIQLDDDRIDPPPEIGMEFDTAFVRGIGKQAENYTVILDVEKIILSAVSETDQMLLERKPSGGLQNVSA